MINNSLAQSKLIVISFWRGHCTNHRVDLWSCWTFSAHAFHQPNGLSVLPKKCQDSSCADSMEKLGLRVFYKKLMKTITTYSFERMKESPYVVSLALLISIPVELYICLWVGWYPILDLFSFCLPCPLTLFGFLKNLLWSFKSTWTYLNPFFDHLQGTKCMVALSLSLWIMLNSGSSSTTKVFMRGSGDLHVILFYHSNTVSGSGVYLFK